VRSLLQKDFVVLKIDLQRMTGGDRLLAGLRDASSKELPWMAVFDSSGKLVATSDVDADGCRNIQFPQSDADIAHFGWMLAQGSLRLFAPDIQKLEDSLRAERERRSKRSKTGPTEVRPGDARPGGARPDGGADTDGSGG
jgi:hypothetical protein